MAILPIKQSKKPRVSKDIQVHLATKVLGAAKDVPCGLSRGGFHVPSALQKPFDGWGRGGGGARGLRVNPPAPPPPGNLSCCEAFFFT